jgi:hypothetical protein
MSAYVSLDQQELESPKKGLFSESQKQWIRARGFGVFFGTTRLLAFSNFNSGPTAPLVISTVSGLINGMLLFSFAAVFASLIFEHHFNEFVPVGLNIFTGSGFVTGLAGVLFSRFFVGIVGPGESFIWCFLFRSLTFFL